MANSWQAPEAWQSGKCNYASGLSLETAKKMLEAGEKEAIKLGVPMAMSIYDCGGNILAFHRMDHTILASSQISMDKAYTAVYGKLPTGVWAGIYGSAELVPLFFHDRWITFPGGFPILKNGALMGGLGVSGGKVEDVMVARAALKAGGFDTKATDEVIEKVKPEVPTKQNKKKK